jgi:hypothetical protein
MDDQALLEWLLKGDISIRYQTMRDLMDVSEEDLTSLRRQIPYEGYAASYLSFRDAQTGLWANGIYTPKWTSTHYTLLELKNLCMPGDFPAYAESAKILLDAMWYDKGRIRKDREQDICVSAMVGSIACHAGLADEKIHEIAGHLLSHIQKDGGFNCAWQRSEVSSIHSTLTVLLFFQDYLSAGYAKWLPEIASAIPPAEEWLLARQLYKRLSDGTPVLQSALNIPYPTRYKYDILKALDYFQSSKHAYDERMRPALDVLSAQRRPSGAWPVTGQHAGPVHFKMEQGPDSRINTLRALRVFKAYREGYEG